MKSMDTKHQFSYAINKKVTWCKQKLDIFKRMAGTEILNYYIL